MTDLLRKNVAVIVNLIIVLVALAFGYGFLHKDVQDTRDLACKNEASIEMMRQEWQRDVKIILEKVSTLDGYVKAKSERE
jgi:hypothetical protein